MIINNKIMKRSNKILVTFLIIFVYFIYYNFDYDFYTWSLKLIHNYQHKSIISLKSRKKVNLRI